jgi:two-component system, cell cycle sensor histidine kinase and response regulator CckA
VNAQQLADFVADAVVATDLGNRVTYWNGAAERLFGWQCAEVLGHPTLELFRVSFKSATLEEATRHVAATGRWAGIVTQRAKDGRTILCEAIVARLPDGQGNVTILRDLAERQILIDELRHAQEHLAAALAFNTNLVDAAPVGIVTYRVSGPCVSGNAAAAEIVGDTVEQLRQQDFRAIPSWKQSGLLDLAERAIATRAPQAAEITLLTTYGRNSWVQVRLAVFRSPEEDILLLMITDISERKGVEEELRETERVLRASQAELRKLSRAIEQSPASVVITDRLGNIEYVNPSFSAASGYSPEEVIGHNPRMFKSGQSAEDTYRGLWSTITTGGTWRGELRNRTKSGELHWVRATISPIFDDCGIITHFVAIEEHIDAEKAAEEAAREANRRFVGAQRMEGIGQLAGGIAHDFNNLLTAILGYSDLVLSSIQDNPALAADVNEIKKAGERAARLTRQLLAFSRKQRLERQNVNLNQIVGDLMKMVGRVIGENIHVELTADADLGLAKLDPGQTEQIVMNLVVNARDAMSRGGRLSIGTANAELDAEFAESHPGASPGSYVALRVSDTGTGMPPDIVARIFEPFFTTKPLGQGTGLGLATVYGIVKQSDGYVSVDSTVGEGTTFAVYFPRLGAGTLATEADAASNLPLHGSETILVAEDEPALRRVIQRALTCYGYNVLLASDGVAALAAEERHAAPIDLLLTDIVMRDVGGLELAKTLVRRRPQMKLLFMSGFDYHPEAPAGGGESGAAFLPKPFTPEGLAQKVREVLNRPGHPDGNRE